MNEFLVLKRGLEREKFETEKDREKHVFTFQRRRKMAKTVRWTNKQTKRPNLNVQRGGKQKKRSID